MKNILVIYTQLDNYIYNYLHHIEILQGQRERTGRGWNILNIVSCDNEAANIVASNLSIVYFVVSVLTFGTVIVLEYKCNNVTIRLC